MVRLSPAGLVLFILQLSQALVPPPANVTLQCRNLRNILRWDYDRVPPGLRFRVDIGQLAASGSYPDHLWVDPPTLQANVSFLSDPSNDYFLTVTAVIGQNESDPAPPDGIVFSYFIKSQAPQICALDLPPVNVSRQPDNNILIEFWHPWLFYHQSLGLKRGPGALADQRLPELRYDVTVTNQKPFRGASCTERVCQKTLAVDGAQAKHCVSITGELRKMSVEGTREFCAQEHAEPHKHVVVLAVVISLLAVLLVSFILFMIFRKMTRSLTPFPESMKFPGQLKQWTLGSAPEPIVVPEEEPKSPSPLVPSTAASDSTFFSEPVLRLPIGTTIQDNGAQDMTEAERDAVLAYLQGGNLEDDDDNDLTSGEPPSSYEKRRVLVELAPDEQAEGYRGRGDSS